MFSTNTEEPVFVDTISTIYKHLNDLGKKQMRKEMTAFLERTFKEDLKDNVERFLNRPALGILPLISLLVGAYGAKKHNLRMHHGLVYTALALITLAIAIMIYQSRGLPTTYGKLGFSIFLYILTTAASGKLFLGKKIARNQHRILALLAIPLLFFKILHGLFTFVF